MARHTRFKAVVASLEAQAFWLGAILGAVGMAGAYANIETGRVTDDRRLYENLSEIRAQKARDLRFDADVSALAKMEARYREGRLPRVGARKPVRTQPRRSARR